MYHQQTGISIQSIVGSREGELTKVDNIDTSRIAQISYRRGVVTIVGRNLRCCLGTLWQHCQLLFVVSIGPAEIETQVVRLDTCIDIIHLLRYGNHIDVISGRTHIRKFEIEFRLTCGSLNVGTVYTVERINGKNVLVLDDVISLGGSMNALRGLAEAAGGIVVGEAAAVAEGAAARRKDIIFLASMPLFDAQ